LHVIDDGSVSSTEKPSAVLESNQVAERHRRFSVGNADFVGISDFCSVSAPVVAVARPAPSRAAVMLIKFHSRLMEEEGFIFPITILQTSRLPSEAAHENAQRH
jgi:hypothetical protein